MSADDVTPLDGGAVAALNVIDALASDHRELEQLLADLAVTPSTEAARRVEVFSRVQALLQAHSRAEEEVVYRRLRQRIPDEPKVLEAFEEHHVADVLLQELASACPGGRGWSAKIRVLDEMLRLHIKEEELDLFALVQAQFDADTLTLMAREFRALKHEGVESLLGPLRRATPAFAGRAMVSAQALAGRLVRRGELAVRHALSRLPA